MSFLKPRRAAASPAPAPPDEGAGGEPAQASPQLLLALEQTTHLWAAIDRAYDELLPAARLRCIVCDREGARGAFGLHEDVCVFGGGRLERYECPSCGCLFGPKKYLDLSEAAVDSDYRFLYSRYAEADSTDNEIKTFHALRPRRDGLYLDWGCGGVWSRTVATLRGDGWDVWGYEPSAEVSSGHVVRSRDEISAVFNGIFSNNVIEHFRQPIAAFRDFHRLLAEGGSMAHSSPCYERAYTHTRFHTLFLTGRSPQVLAERTGFEVADRIEEGEYINLVFRKRRAG